VISEVLGGKLIGAWVELLQVMDMMGITSPIDKGQGVLLVDGACSSGMYFAGGKAPGVLTGSTCCLLRLIATFVIYGNVFEPLNGGEDDSLLFRRISAFLIITR